MAKRKAPRARRRTLSAKRARTRGTAGRGRKKQAPRKRTARKAGASARLRKASAVRARKATARKATKKKTLSKARRASVASGKARARKQAKPSTRTKRTSPRKAAPRPAAMARKAPALNRERRTIIDDDLVPTPPSSLDLDRTASAARSGRRELHERLAQHTETSPAMTGGDIDADWESAYSVGDEAPGGDNPTPDQDIVDDIGKAVGVQYEDNEELKSEKKITDRDRKRWELDPASSEDYNDR